MPPTDSPPWPRPIVSWIVRLVPAAILAMAAIPKLTSAPDAVALFSIVGVEPWGRFALGAVELTTTILLVVPRTFRVGAVIGVVLMAGAIGAHLLKLGIFYGGDPSLFIMAVVAFAGSAAVLWLHRSR
ncbi:MAG: DoxX family protein [Gemmatimonadota bacterium]|nr:DoxX family protein [Gemmatimonadota bacterium]